SARAAPPTAHPAAAACVLADGARTWRKIKGFHANCLLRSSPRKRGPRAANRGPWIPAYAGMNGGERRILGVLPPPLWGRLGEGGGAVMHRRCLTQSPPHPQPLPTRGRGADRIRCTRLLPSHAHAVTPAAAHGSGWAGRAGGCARRRRSSLGARARPRIPAPGGAARGRAW